MFVSLLPGNLSQIYRIMVAQTSYSGQGDGFLPAWKTDTIVFTWSARRRRGDAHTFSLPGDSLDFPVRGSPGEAWYIMLSHHFAFHNPSLRTPTPPSSLWAAPDSSSPVLYTHGGVYLPWASVWNPSCRAVYGGVHPVCCLAEAGRNSDRKSPALRALCRYCLVPRALWVG